MDERDYKKVVAGVKKGKSLSEVAAELDLSTGNTATAYYRAELEVDPDLEIKSDDAKAVVKARDKDELRWERIAIYSGQSMAKVRELYAEGGGDTESSWTGRGRKPAGAVAAEEETTSSKRGSTKRSSTKRSSAKSSSAAPAGRQSRPPAKRSSGKRSSGKRSSGRSSAPKGGDNPS